MSITNILAIAMLSGSPGCPPGDTVGAGKPVILSAPVNQQPISAAPLAESKPGVLNLPDANLGGDNAEPMAAMDQSTLNVPSSVEVPDPQAQSSEMAAESSPSAPNGVEQGTIIVTANVGPPPGDPAEAVNEVAFGAVQAVDDAIIAPIASGYKNALSEPIRDGIHNLLNNLDEPVVFINFLLQLKIGKAIETVGRFAINSTVGVAGLFDAAKKKPFNLPRRSNGLANTLGYYGVGPGPYLFLPLIGSTTVRDLFGQIVDLSFLPNAVGKPFTRPLVSITRGTLSAIDGRVQNDETLTRIQQSGNPYAAMREYYLKKRQAEIDFLKGKRCNANIELKDLEYMDSLPAATNTKTGKSVEDLKE